LTAGVHRCIDVVKRNVADLQRVELDPIDRRDAARCLRVRAITGEIVDAGAPRIVGADRHDRCTGVDQETDACRAVDQSADQEMPLVVRREDHPAADRGRVSCRRNAIAGSECERAPLPLHFEDGILGGGADETHALRRALTCRERARLTAVDDDRGLTVRERDDLNVGRQHPCWEKQKR